MKMKGLVIVFLWAGLILATPILPAQKIYYPDTKPTVPLKDLPVEEINKIFLEVNIKLKRAELDKLTEEVATKLNGVMLVQQGDIVIEKVVKGYTRLDQKTKANEITEQTAFDLASVSKQFTAAAVLQLVVKGKLSLKDTLRKFFPELPYNGITIHQLLTHTSGLPEYFNFSEALFDRTKLMSNEDLVEVLAKEKPEIAFLPGHNFIYTNTNYALLVLIVEKVSGMPFEEYAEKNIFKPAGMTHTFYITQREEKIKQKYSIALGHESTKGPLKEHFMDGTIGDKGLYSCMEDLALWKKAFFDAYKILPKAWVKRATSPQNNLVTGKEPSKPYGYGWRLEDNETLGMLVFHGGLWHGFVHVELYDPISDIYILFLSNLRNGAHRGKTNQILQILNGA